MMIIETDIETILTINNQIPEFAQPRRLDELTTKARDRYLALVYLHDGINAGFKFGYEQSPTIFYSWLGGVFPEYRGQGIAQKLLTYQEAWCRRQGYQSIKVKSTNLFKPMLFMLIKNDYKITGTEHSKRLEITKILFQKEI